MGPSEAARVRQRVLRALQAVRTPGFHFPGYLLGIQWSAVAPERSLLSMQDGPHVRNTLGEVDLLAVCVLADVALGTAVRARDRTSDRLSTIYLQLQFTGVAARGNLSAEAKLLDTSVDTRLEQRLSSATLFADDRAICHGSGTFVALEPIPNVVMGPLPWQRTEDAREPMVNEATLSDTEREALRLCDLQLASDDEPFLERFWLGPAQSGAEDVIQVVPGVHTSNRVGHVQGGLLVGAAAVAGSAAAPPGMRLANISARYVSPGRGTLPIRSNVLHRGRNTALVRNVIETDASETVLEAMSQYVALL